jgi:hypothetical protein
VKDFDVEFAQDIKLKTYHFYASLDDDIPLRDSTTLVSNCGTDLKPQPLQLQDGYVEPCHFLRKGCCWDGALCAARAT